MISFPNAKINLGLNILSKRKDGYHNLSSCFYPVRWQDILEIIPSKELAFTSSGVKIPGNSHNNLCIQAYNLLNENHQIPPVRIHLHKKIPIGAGLGGGSSDGAFTLKMLNQIFNIKLSVQQLEQYASQLGSDCPFFIQNKPVIATGTGTELYSTSLDLSGIKIIIKHPNLHISTKEAYAGIIPKNPQYSLEETFEQPISNWKSHLINDFEKSIGLNHPEIATIKKQFYSEGALYASMSGSGSAVFGIFSKDFQLSTLSDPNSFLEWGGTL